MHATLWEQAAPAGAAISALRLVHASVWDAAHLQLDFAGQVALPGTLLRHLATAVLLCSPCELRLLLRIQLRLLDILGR